MNVLRQPLSRRQLVKGAGVAGLGTLAAMVPAAALADDDRKKQRLITGAWLIRVVSDGPTAVPHEVLNLYTADGGVAGASSDELEPAHLGTSVYGAWARTGERQFAITFMAFQFTPQGNPSGKLKVRAKATLSADGDHIAGPAVIEFSPPGVPFFQVATTNFSGTRIKPEPI